MRARVVSVGVCLLAIAVTVTGFFALAEHAEAQPVEAADCRAALPLVLEQSGLLMASGDHLLTRDGYGFFSADIDSIAVRGAGFDPAVAATTEAIARSLADFYDTTDVDVITDLDEQTSEPARVVIIDGDIAVPGHPTVFNVGGVPTLYLHWTSGVTEIVELLDVPEFASFAASATSDTCASSEAAVAAVPGVTPEPDDILAYVDEEPDTASPASGRTPVSPLADTSSPELPPLPVAAAAIVVAAGGVVLHQRDKIWGDRFAPRPQPAEALIHKSKPVYPTADLPPAHPRVIFLDEDEAPPGQPNDSKPPLAQREIDLHAKKVESPLTRLVEKVASKSEGSLVARHEFARLVNTEWSRHKKGGRDGAVASLVVSELDAVRLRLGNNAAEALFAEVSEYVIGLARPLDVIGLAGENELAILMPSVNEDEARAALDSIAQKLASLTFTSGDERVLLTPATGFAMLSDTQSAPDLIRAVESARALSMLNLHLNPERWDSQAEPVSAKADRASLWTRTKAKLRTPMQIAITFIIAWIVPFFIYFGLDSVGLDISWPTYLFLVASLVLTGAFILAEGFMAIKQKEPPEVPTQPYPKATALIAAYMPNEAATVIETIEAFLAIEYPNELQIILAYNTPDPLPVEEHLDRIAAEHPNFMPVRIVGSNSKAQNVNAALSMAEGEFIGMFDADHQPRPDAFTRAWRWLDDGYDVVQGHCLTRNGDAGFLAKMIAVEFEGIYSVAHPGRAKMHRFGVFGGSNGFWRTELLHETRMRGSMLTEDIDSSMRVVGRGFKIRSDRDLVSRELATTTFKQIWNQRMRWAQGWFQVSMEHVKLAWRSNELTVRQKLGIFHLLLWREVYPWLSQQLWPLLAFWAVKAGGFDRLDWTIPIFVATSIFTFSVGPLQTVFTYKLADPEIKQHKSWFWGYLFFTTPFYTEYKNLIARVAHVKQFMGESDWRVTPRSAD